MCDLCGLILFIKEDCLRKTSPGLGPSDGFSFPGRFVKMQENHSWKGENVSFWCNSVGIEAEMQTGNAQ